MMRVSPRKIGIVEVEMPLLITGAAGKVGTQVRAGLSGDTRFSGWKLRALCHTRPVEGQRLESV